MSNEMEKFQATCERLGYDNCDDYWQIWQAARGYSPPNGQVEIAHTTATKDNVETVLDGLLHSFVEVAQGFPSAKIDEQLCRQAITYMTKKDWE
jgi:hypothetical protein